jgi:hypothetical protein
MDPLQKADISKISSNEILKSVFSNLNSKRILEIVQKNKNLQKKLGINIEHYKSRSDLPKYEYIQEKAIILKKHRGDEELAYYFHICLITCCTSIFFIYTLIYAILLVAKDTFDESNTKENYDKSKENKINTINICIFILVGSVIISWFVLVFFVFKNCYRDYGIKKVIKYIILIIISLLHISFEGLVISKLVFSYEIKKDGSTWFIVMDYIFIVLNFIHIVFIILNIIGYFYEGGMSNRYITQCTLMSFNNVLIQPFGLPENFPKWKKKERKRFISDNYWKFELFNPNEIRINMSLNMVKTTYDIPKFEKYDIQKIPDYILDEPGEMMLYPDRNIYKLSNKGYIFRYPIGEFENILNENSDDNIKNILSKDNLTFYQVITQKDKEIIYVFEPKKESDFDIFKRRQKKQKNDEFSHELLYNNIHNGEYYTRKKFIE